MWANHASMTLKYVYAQQQALTHKGSTLFAVLYHQSHNDNISKLTKVTKM